MCISNRNGKQFSSNDSLLNKSVCKVFIITPKHEVYGYEICFSFEMYPPNLSANMTGHLDLFKKILKDYTNAQFGLKNFQFCSTNC